jgi:phage baseplate assembly protein gpV
VVWNADTCTFHIPSITLNGQVDINGSLNVNGPVTVSDGLSVGSDIHFNSDQSVAGKFTSLEGDLQTALGVINAMADKIAALEARVAALE